MQKKYLSLIYSMIFSCGCMSATWYTPIAKAIEFKMESKFDTNDEIKIKTIKDLENEAQQIKLKRDEQKRIELENLKRQQEEEIKRKEQEERMRNKREFILTFYSSLSEENGEFGAITCNGERLHDGIVANNVYKLGTKIQLEGYGEVVVADRGGSNFNENTRLDVYVPRKNDESNYEYSKRVNNMGKVKVTGYILNK